MQENMSNVRRVPAVDHQEYPKTYQMTGKKGGL